MKMEVTIVNDTPYTFEVGDGSHISQFNPIGRMYPVKQKGSSYTYEFFQDTLVDWNLFLRYTVDGSELYHKIPAQDNEQAREIRVYVETPSNEIGHWISKPRRSSIDLGTGPITPAIKVTMKVTIVNDTPYTFVVGDGSHISHFNRIGKIYPMNEKGSSYTYEFFQDTIVEWNLFLKYAVHSSMLYHVIPAQDNEQAREIRVYETLSNEIRHWISKPWQSSDDLWTWPIPPPIKDLDSFEALKGEVSTRMETIAKHQKNLKNLLEQVKICHAQCKHLVLTYSEGLQKMMETYSMVSQSLSRMWSLYECKKLRLLTSSLDSLIRSLITTHDLLQDCGDSNEYKRIALLVSMPPPKQGTYSQFGVLIRELNWILDVIEYASSLEQLEFTWSEERRRYVLKRNQETSSSNAEVALQDWVDYVLVHSDRMSLLSQLEKTLTSQINRDSSNWDEFTAVVKKRLQSSSDNNPGLIPDCFQINSANLLLRRCLSGGSVKMVYQGEWLGQPVAIAKIKGCTRDAIEREAGFMVEVQHPNIADFFGCTHEEKTKEEPLEDEAPELTGYLVTELMQEDLRSLIDREVKCHSGAPFSFSVSVDILLQIVEAMIHLQKHHLIYRDLKAKNCLVSPRAKSSRQDPDVYTVKLIDFGTCKALDSENDGTDTVDVGTHRWIAPEVWAVNPTKRDSSTASTGLFPLGLLSRKQREPAKLYSRSADVYSFAMTCYEITTGLLPFHDVENRDIPSMILREKRPSFSHPAAMTCPLRLQKLMTECWAQKPRDRPHFEDIRRELWSIKYDIEVQP